MRWGSEREEKFMSNRFVAFIDISGFKELMKHG
jgi:hypothetical protein